MRKRPSRNLSFVVISIVLVLVVLAFILPQNSNKSVPLSEVVQKVKDQQVDRVEVDGNKLTVTLKDPNAQKLVAYKEDSSVSLTQYGINPSEVTVDTKNPSNGAGRWVDIFLVSLLPIFLIMGFFYFKTNILKTM